MIMSHNITSGFCGCDQSFKSREFLPANRRKIIRFQIYEGFSAFMLV